MIIKKISYLSIVFVLMLMPGCSSKTQEPEKKEKIIGFHTDQSQFLTYVDKKSPTITQRNELLDEFITQSNLQCQHYLNSPLNKSESNSKKQGLYMDIFDGVSEAFGVKNITDTAKKLYKGKDKDKRKYQTKMAYEKALSPEIKRGVEIAREKYVQKMILRKSRLIESYTIAKLRRDMRNYDKLCNYEYGLIEIHKALKKAQQKEKIQPFSPTMTINLTNVKDKVEAVTKEAEANK